MRRSGREPLRNDGRTYNDHHDASAGLHRTVQVDLEHLDSGLVSLERRLLDNDHHDERAHYDDDQQSMPLPDNLHHNNNDDARALRMPLSALLRPD